MISGHWLPQTLLFSPGENHFPNLLENSKYMSKFTFRGRTCERDPHDSRFGRNDLHSPRSVWTGVRPVCVFATRWPYSLIAFGETLVWENYSYICLFFLFPLSAPAPSVHFLKVLLKILLAVSLSQTLLLRLSVFLNPVSNGSHPILHRNLPTLFIPTGWSTNSGPCSSTLGSALSLVLEPYI